MSNEELAAKLHRCKDGSRHHKAIYWKGAWHILTGVFGKVGKEPVAQYRSQFNTIWQTEKGEPIRQGTPIKSMWQEIVTDITDVPW